MFEYVQIFIFPEMFFSSRFQVVLAVTNITSIRAGLGKLVNNIGLKKFRSRISATEKTSNF